MHEGSPDSLRPNSDNTGVAPRAPPSRQVLKPTVSPEHHEVTDSQPSAGLVKIINIIYLSGCTGSLLWHVGSSSLTKDRTRAPCTGNVKS